MASPVSESHHVLSVSADDAEAACEKPSVQQAVEEGWEVKAVWRAGFAGRTGSFFMVKMERAGAAGPGAWLRPSLRRYGLAGLLVVALLLGAWALLLAGTPLGGSEGAEPAESAAEPRAHPAPNAGEDAGEDAGEEAALPGEDTADIASLDPLPAPLGERQREKQQRRLPSEARPSTEARSAEAPPEEASSAGEAGASSENGQENTPSTGALRLTSQPAGAQVLLDGEAAGQTPLRVADLPAGTHDVTFRADGHEPRARRVTVRVAETQTVEATLQARTGTLSVMVKPWGRLYVDGTLRKREADVMHTMTLAVGRHRVVVEHPQLGRWEKNVDVTVGEAQSVTVNLNEGAAEGTEEGPDSSS